MALRERTSGQYWKNRNRGKSKHGLLSMSGCADLKMGILRVRCRPTDRLWRWRKGHRSTKVKEEVKREKDKHDRTSCLEAVMAGGPWLVHVRLGHLAGKRIEYPRVTVQERNWPIHVLGSHSSRRSCGEIPARDVGRIVSRRVGAGRCSDATPSPLPFESRPVRAITTPKSIDCSANQKPAPETILRPGSPIRLGVSVEVEGAKVARV